MLDFITTIDRNLISYSALSVLYNYYYKFDLRYIRTKDLEGKTINYLPPFPLLFVRGLRPYRLV